MALTGEQRAQLVILAVLIFFIDFTLILSWMCSVPPPDKFHYSIIHPQVEQSQTSIENHQHEVSGCCHEGISLHFFIAHPIGRCIRYLIWSKKIISTTMLKMWSPDDRETVTSMTKSPAGANAWILLAILFLHIYFLRSQMLLCWKRKTWSRKSQQHRMRSLNWKQKWPKLSNRNRPKP